MRLLFKKGGRFARFSLFISPLVLRVLSPEAETVTVVSVPPFHTLYFNQRLGGRMLLARSMDVSGLSRLFFYLFSINIIYLPSLNRNDVPPVRQCLNFTFSGSDINLQKLMVLVAK
eukprot:TRINITY_DN867_c3_g3_i1.p1 TRINITY_DN867_c3_g3~~TRINITY_DN867_c3_g3_i1.p1  ORF type:complete len:116 (+),score=4.48 TRINITY_DN867_c3_g3_i1:605-952(+)